MFCCKLIAREPKLRFDGWRVGACSFYEAFRASNRFWGFAVTVTLLFFSVCRPKICRASFNVDLSYENISTKKENAGGNSTVLH